MVVVWWTMRGCKWDEDKTVVKGDCLWREGLIKLVNMLKTVEAIGTQIQKEEIETKFYSIVSELET